MNGTPLNPFGSPPEPFVSIADEVQAELDRHTASLRNSCANTSSIMPEALSINAPSATGIVVGTLLSPFAHTLFALACQRIFAPELMADEQYGLMLIGTLPYGLMLGGYLGARLPELLRAGRWRHAAAWLALVGGLILLGVLASVSGVARLYLPFFAIPCLSLLWVETMSRCKE